MITSANNCKFYHKPTLVKGKVMVEPKCPVCRKNVAFLQVITKDGCTPDERANALRLYRMDKIQPEEEAVFDAWLAAQK